MLNVRDLRERVGEKSEKILPRERESRDRACWRIKYVACVFIQFVEPCKSVLIDFSHFTYTMNNLSPNHCV